MPKRRYKIIAIVSGVVACILLAIFLIDLRQNFNQKIEQAGETIQVIVAGEDLPMGVLITSDMLVQKRFLADSMPQGYHTSKENLENQYLIVPVFKGQIITDGHISSINEVSPSNMVPSGHVAYALVIDPELGVGGLVQAGDRVDIISTTGNQFGEESKTKILLENVSVIGVAGEYPFGPAPTPTPLAGETGGGNFVSDSSSFSPYGEGVKTKILIFDMLPEQARLLAEARANSTVSVALHSTRK